jgi:ABC-type glycerol-3-phosphate transport system substrate-binding protein
MSTMKPMSNYSHQSALIVVICVSVLFTLSLSMYAARSTIEFLYSGGQTYEEAISGILATFEEANPDVKVDRIRVQGSYRDKLIALIAAGTVPDVVEVDMHDIMAFHDERFFYDLAPLAQKTPAYQVQRIATPMLDMYTVDGKLVAVPSLANPSLYVYNVDVFDQSGLAYPADLYKKNAWTWSAFRDMARKATRKEADGRFSVVGASLHLPRTWLFSNGGAEFDDPKRPTQTFLDSETSLETVQFLHSMIWEDQALLPAGRMPAEIGANDEIGFSQGKIGMASRWISSVPAYGRGASDIGLVPYPKGPGPHGRYATDLGSWGIAITRQTKDVEAAWRFVSSITGPAASAIWAKLPGQTPPRPVQLAWLPEKVHNPGIYWDLLSYGTMRVISRDRLNLQRVIDAGLNSVWSNMVEPKSALSEISRQIRAFLKENPQ